MRSLTLRAGLLAGIAALGACVHTPAPAYQPSVDTTERLLAKDGTANVGAFDAAAGVDNESLTARAATMSGGPDGLYSTYLRDALAAELKAAGRFDAGSPTVVTGTLTRNTLDAAIDKGHATVGARFVVTRDGQAVYDRTLAAEHAWDSSFIAMIAVPAAMQGYVATVQELLGELFADPEFERAIGGAAGEVATATAP